MSSLPSISEGQAPNMFHKTLGAIWSAMEESNQPSWMGYLDERTTTKRWEDDVELVDPGLWTEHDDGNDIELDEYGEGIVVRYRPVSFKKRLAVPIEIEEEAVYEEITAVVPMLQRTWVQTQNVYAVGLVDDFATSGVTGGDGVVLASASHPLAGGGTVSNILSPALLPCNRAIQLMIVAAEKMRGSNGQIAGNKVLKACGPSNHKHRLKEVLKSEKRDDTANNAINALKGELSADPVSIPHMASSTNWFVKTNAPRGAAWVWLKKATFKSGMEIKNDCRIQTGRAKATVNYSNFRTFIISLS